MLHIYLHWMYCNRHEDGRGQGGCGSGAYHVASVRHAVSVVYVSINLVIFQIVVTQLMNNFMFIFCLFRGLGFAALDNMNQTVPTYFLWSYQLTHCLFNSAQASPSIDQI